MPESFIPVWMSIGEAEEFRRFLQEEARSTDGEFPEREFDLINSALNEERPRTFEELERERTAPQHHSTEEASEDSLDAIRSAASEFDELEGAAMSEWAQLLLELEAGGWVLTRQPAPSSTEEGRG